MIPVGIAIVAILGVAVYVLGPDIPYEKLPAREELRSQIPFLSPSPSEPLPPPDPALSALAMSPNASQQSPAVDEAGEKRAQMQGVRLPITTVSIGSSPRGRLLSVGVDYPTLVGNQGSGGAAEALFGVITLAGHRPLNLTGIQDMSVSVHDHDSRVLYAASVPVEAVERFRAGAISQRELTRAIGFKGVSRVGVIDAVRRKYSQP
jgi:hypothetical protein